MSDLQLMLVASVLSFLIGWILRGSSPTRQGKECRCHG